MGRRFFLSYLAVVPGVQEEARGKPRRPKEVLKGLGGALSCCSRVPGPPRHSPGLPLDPLELPQTSLRKTLFERSFKGPLKVS